MKGCRAPLWIPLFFAAAQAGAAGCQPPARLSEAIAAGHEYVVKARVVRVRPPLGAGVLPVACTLRQLVDAR